MINLVQMLSQNLQNFRWQVKTSHLARLFQILTDVYGIPKLMANLRSMEGMEVEASFPQMNQQFARIGISHCQFYPRPGKAERPVATVIFNMSDEEIVPIINDVIRTNATLGGLFKLVIKYLLPRKIILKGSLLKAITFIKCIMLGKHPMYLEEQKLKALSGEP